MALFFSGRSRAEPRLLLWADFFFRTFFSLTAFWLLRGDPAWASGPVWLERFDGAAGALSTKSTDPGTLIWPEP